MGLAIDYTAEDLQERISRLRAKLVAARDKREARRYAWAITRFSERLACLLEETLPLR